MIMCDQMVAALTGAYGHPVVQTPNLDRLGAKACASTRPIRPALSARRPASLMTGKYVSNIGCYDNSTYSLSEEPTLCHYLSIAGYDTVVSGKLHFAGPDQLHGFEKRLTTDMLPADFEFLARDKGTSAIMSASTSSPLPSTM